MGIAVKQAQKFIHQISHALGHAIPLHHAPLLKTVFIISGRKARLPENLDPLKVNLKDSIERKTLTKLLDAGLNQPVGFTLPIKWDWSRTMLEKRPLGFRRGAMFLIPGNSPMGMRLPLASLPWVAPDKRDYPRTTKSV